MHKLVKIDYSTPLYEQALELRYEVLRKPMGRVYNEEELLHDRQIIYFGYIKNDEMLGVAGLEIENEKRGRILQVAVNDKAQGQGIGREVISYAESYAKSVGLEEVYLHSRYEPRRFYERLGYSEYGEIYEKIGIPHINMKKLL